MWFWKHLAAFAASALLATSVAAATLPPETEPDGSIGLPMKSPVRIGNDARQAELANSPAWQSFRARNGEWKAIWNEATGTPHRAFGRGIRLPGFAEDGPSADRAVRTFVAGHPELFGPTPELASVAAMHVRNLWYVRFHQTFHGVPVRFADWEFRVGTGGKLFAFGADAARPQVEPNTTPRIVGAVAREAAKTGLAFNAATDRVEGGTDLCLIPWPKDGGTEYRLAWEARVRTANPPGDWTTYVDASTGEVLYRQNGVRYEISGIVSGMIHPALANDPLQSRPFPHQFVQVGGITSTTDAVGKYSGAPGGTVTVSAQLRGQYCDVNRADGPDASFSTSATDPSMLDIVWDDVHSNVAERDGYISVNKAHDYIKELDPTFTGLDYSMPCAVNLPNGTCNAYWDQTGVNFYPAGGGCPNMATIANVIYHEYGHGVNDRVYFAASGSFMSNGALHEGMADVNASFMQDDPAIGRGFMGAGTILRRLDNTMHWPQDASGDPHITGLIIGGSFWDLRLTVGLSVAQNLAHFARYGAADDPDDGVAMHEYFIETLVADDDDANLANGTPNSTAIVNAFNLHGIGTAYSIAIAHSAPPDQPLGANVPITATITYSGVIGALDTASPAAHLSVNNGPWQIRPLTPTGSPNQFGGTLPVPNASVARYYITASDTYGGTGTHPEGAPDANLFTFVVGPATTALSADMEADPGWTVGGPTDGATTGIWVRADPVGTDNLGVPVQPEDDHTPGAGVRCWVTGNGVVGGPPGAADVDNGHTTVTSAVFNATAGGIVHPIVEYYRWYTNNQGSAPSSDVWRVDISNNAGATWANIEYTTKTLNEWLRVVFRIEDYLPPTNNMQVRFIADDSNPGSLVEAAVDDFRLIGFPASVNAVGPADLGGTLALASSPNPWSARATIRFALPSAGPVSLRIYDLGGRLVRSLADGTFTAGSHAREWDGRDDGGRRVATGAYFVRLRHDGSERVEKLVKVE